MKRSPKPLGLRKRLDHLATQLAAAGAPDDARQELAALTAAIDRLLAAARRATTAPTPSDPLKPPGYKRAQWEQVKLGWLAREDVLTSSGLHQALNDWQ